MIKFSASSPAKHRKCILICIDKNYECFAFALAKQIIDRHPDLPADICIVAEYKVTPPVTLQDLPVRYCEISVDRGTIHFPEKGHVTFSTYLSHFTVTKMADTYDRILYLDVDVFISGPDLPKLLDLELLEGHAVGAVRDRFQQSDMATVPQDCKNLGIPYFPYFNAGVFLVDTREWVAQDIMARMLEAIRHHGQAFVFADQSAINLALRGMWSELPWHWNFIFQRQLFFEAKRVDPTVIHFAGGDKPWAIGAQIAPSGVPAYFQKFLETHFPEVIESGRLPVAQQRRFQRLRFRKYDWKTRSQWKAYTARFPDKTSVLDPWDM